MQVEERACCSISRLIKTVDLISERQPQGRVYVCVQDQDKHTGQHVGVSQNFVAVHETSNSTVIGSKPDSSLTALDPWLQNPSETLRRDVKMFERIYRTGASEMQGKKGQISPSNIVWVAWNAGSRLFFRSSAKLGFQPAQNGSTCHISLRFNRKNE